MKIIITKITQSINCNNSNSLFHAAQLGQTTRPVFYARTNLKPVMNVFIAGRELV